MIETPSGIADAYFARPQTDDPVPGVLLFIDAIGLRPQIASMADRIASWGYAVLAPNVFYRDGDAAATSPDEPLDTPEARERFMGGAMKRVMGLTPDKSEPDTDAYLAALLAQPGVTGPVGVTGYCLGARLSTLAAIAHPDTVVACGGFHGSRIATDEPDSIHLGLPRARAEFVYGHADHDTSMPPEAVELLGAALASAGLTATNAIYPDAPHGYTMADTPNYQEAGSERHFTELEALFARTLGDR
ncbi:dienelactone hydrolase family protein [Tsukamurella spumae]|uniref:Dienelactone hydrolase family protein n=1 Tax=Tsukamurella spumae TaxID=44753 RepID=A0A846X077_9ACTN|nr:dienelactone hydrolase family protein [Tsukamurella spumae]NKY18511.1 dienelactone hydrolase family protein [Tsukamurella spumae]